MSSIEEAKKKLAEQEQETSERTDAGDQTGVMHVEEVAAASLVSDDTDRPRADNDLPDTGPYVPPAPDGQANETEAQKDARRGKWSEEKKAKGRATRAARRSDPQFNDLPGGQPSPVSLGGPPPRNYYQEALQIFVPTSFFAANMLGTHWGIEIAQPEFDAAGKLVKEGGIKLAPDQQQYVATMAEWLKFEQFGPMNGRLAFIVATCAYIIPKVKTDPTPAKLKKAWDWVKAKTGWFKGKK